MKSSNLTIGNETIHPGESISLGLPMPELFSCAPLHMPIMVKHGKTTGPCVLVTAALNGNELNGTEIIHRFLSMSSLKKLKGTVIAVPVLNVYGLINRSKYLPGGVDLDRCFPGSETGTHGARIAHLFLKAIYAKADVCIDLQTGPLNHTNLPQIYTDLTDTQSITLASAFNAPVISSLPLREGTYSSIAIGDHKPFLLYEAGEAMRFNEDAIRAGVRGLSNILKKLGMLPEKNQKKNQQHLKSFITEKNIWVRASTSGICQSTLTLGQHVRKGDVLCHIKDPFGASDLTIIKSPEEGVVVGRNNQPLIHEGEALYQLALFNKMEHAANHLESWKEKSQAHYNEHPKD